MESSLRTTVQEPSKIQIFQPSLAISLSSLPPLMTSSTNGNTI